VLCPIVVPLPSGKNLFAVKINDDDLNNNDTYTYTNPLVQASPGESINSSKKNNKNKTLNTRILTTLCSTSRCKT
jgi:2',3'-cyclic-nucleotide 2'-phosphodiesterase (5'-nucleotidase family)